MRFGDTVSVGCFAIDDGEFSIPAELRSAIADATASGWTLDRRHIVNYQQQNAIVQVQRYTQP